MFSVCYLKNQRLLPLLAFPFLVWLLPQKTDVKSTDISSEKINLALRRTADGLLRQSGDSTSRIPAIEQVSKLIWRVRLDQPFNYEQLPAILQSSLDLHGILQAYNVTIRKCVDATIDLGYHQFDFLQQKAKLDNKIKTNDSLSLLSNSNKNEILVPCVGRDMPEGCHYIEISFLENELKNSFWSTKSLILLFILVGFAGYWFLIKQKSMYLLNDDSREPEWLEFGNSRLDVPGQILLCSGIRQTLTFRETKLLKLLVTSPDRLLERDFIIQQVWADEGVLVGRSVDVFVSRLRKKLSADVSIGIVAVHGVGYRLETGK
ncbi:MAG: winged helix-turn-helix domain-containing protein [Saprospiraceae bacterium]|nr:response regulator transcription factor [Saprospiraceae bacterium]MBK8482912.1 response regulator transcription factor [Saprospiraceae bacterium]MBK9726632.1 response regulator transcription factor [Saprospiraceae bacterium]